MDGVSIYKIQKFLGHKSVNMTERYLKFDLKIAQVNMEEIDTFGKALVADGDVVIKVGPTESSVAF